MPKAPSQFHWSVTPDDGQECHVFSRAAMSQMVESCKGQGTSARVEEFKVGFCRVCDDASDLPVTVRVVAPPLEQGGLF